MTSENHDSRRKPTSRQTGQIKTFSEIFSGPVPPPQVLQAFEDVVPGAGQRIFKMAEGEQHHTHKMDRLDRWLPFWEKFIGQVFAFLLGAGLIIGGVYLLINKLDIAGYATLATGIAAIVGPMLIRSRETSSKPAK